MFFHRILHKHQSVARLWIRSCCNRSKKDIRWTTSIQNQISIQLINSSCRNQQILYLRHGPASSIGRRNVSSDTFEYNQLMGEFARKGNVKEVLNLYNEMISRSSDDCKPNIETYSTVMNALGTSEHQEPPERIESIIHELELRAKDDNTLAPDTNTYNTLILAWAKSGRKEASDRLLSILKRMKESTNPNAAPDTTSYNSVIDAFAQQRNVKDVLDLFDEMITCSSDVCKPNIVTYNTVLNALARSNRVDAPDRAEALIKEMELKAKDDDTVAPNTITYSTLIKVWSRSRRNKGHDRAISILNNMKAGKYPNVLPNTVSFNIAIDALAQRGKFKEVFDLFEEMTTCSSNLCKPDTLTYYTILNALARSNHRDAPDRAEALIKDMELRAKDDDTVAPNTITYSTLIQVWSRSRRNEGPDRAISILNKMKAGMYPNVSPNTMSFNIVIDAFAQRGKVKEALDLFDEMKTSLSNAGRPSIVTYNTILKALANSNQTDAPDRAEAIVMDMELKAKDDGTVAPNTITFNTLILVWANSGQKEGPDRALSILNKMKAGMYPNVSPSTRSFNIVMDAFAQQGKVKEVLDLFDEMKTSLSNAGRPSIVTYNTILKALANSNQRDDPEHAEAIFHELKSKAKGDRTLAPDTVTYNKLILVWANSGRKIAPDRALSIFKEMKAGKSRKVSPDKYTYRTVVNLFAKEDRSDEVRHLENKLKNEKDKKTVMMQEITNEEGS